MQESNIFESPSYMQGLTAAISSKTMAVWVRNYPHFVGGYASTGAIMSIDLTDNIVSPWQPSVIFDGVAFATRNQHQWAATSEGWNRSPSGNGGTSETVRSLVGSCSRVGYLLTHGLSDMLLPGEPEAAGCSSHLLCSSKAC
jgi:hypothetical protein